MIQDMARYGTDEKIFASLESCILYWDTTDVWSTSVKIFLWVNEGHLGHANKSGIYTISGQCFHFISTSILWCFQGVSNRNIGQQ